jgi:hypothetical protein
VPLSQQPHESEEAREESTEKSFQRMKFTEMDKVGRLYDTNRS